MAAGRLIVPQYFPAEDSNGSRYPYAKMWTYEDETTTLKNTYADEALTTLNPNPVVANSAGQFPPIWATASTPVLAAERFTVAVWTEDGEQLASYTGVSPTLDADTAAVVLAEAASDAAIFAAGQAEDALEQIEEIAEGSADAPSILNKAYKAASISVLAGLSPTTGMTAVVAGRLTPGDGGGGSFAWVTGNQSANVTADTAQGVWVAPTSAPTGASGAWKRVFDGALNVKWFGAVGDGVTVDRAAFANTIAFADGTPIAVPQGTYLFDQPVLVSASTCITLADDATIKLAANATPISVTLITGARNHLGLFVATADFEIEGGTIDFNRGARTDKAAYSAAGGSNTADWSAIAIRDLAGLSVIKAKIHTTVTGSVDFAVSVQYADEVDLDIKADDSGGAYEAWSVTTHTGRILATNIDNDAWRIFPHAVDFWSCSGGGVEVDVLNQSGYDVAGANSLSNWFSCLTVVGCSGLLLWGAELSALNDPDMTKSVGLSALGNRNCTFSFANVLRFTDAPVECAGNVDCLFTTMLIDNQYLKASISAGTSVGVSMHHGAYIAQRINSANPARRALTPNTRCTFFNVTAVRCLGAAWAVASGVDCTFMGVKGIGSLYGLQLQAALSASDTFPSHIYQEIRGNRFIGYDFSYNEADGILFIDGKDTHFADGQARNNGQAKAWPSPGSGVTRRLGSATTTARGLRSSNTSTGMTKTGNRWVDNVHDDDQTLTGSVTGVLPDAPSVLSLSNPGRFNVGQTIKINDAGAAGADFYTQILDLDQDLATVSEPMLTFPVVSGTGTISTDGVTVTGVGTAFLTQLQYRAVIKVGSDYRRIAKATSNTAAVLESAFPSNLSGASFDVVTILVDQVRSQDYGYQFTSGDISPVLKIASYGAGNITGPVTDTTAAATPALITPPFLGMTLGVSRWVSNSGSPALGTVGGGRVTAWLMDATSIEILSAVVDIPAAWPANVPATLYYVNAGAGAGDVVWNIQYRTAAAGATLNTSFGGSGNLTDTADAQDIVKTKSLGNIPVTPGSPLFIRLQRTGSDAGDTLANDVGFLSLTLG